MALNAAAEFRALVEEYPDPYLRQTLGSAQAVELAEMKGDEVTFARSWASPWAAIKKSSSGV